VSAVLEAREPRARYLEGAQPSVVRQFELLATAPGAGARLRELILSLAVQGKVVQQDSRDEPASELLRRIRSERESLAVAGLIKHYKPVAPISSDEEPSVLPRGWAWVRFGDLIHELCTGPFGSLIHKEDYVSGGVPLVNPSHMNDGRIEHDPEVSVSALMALQLTAYQLSVGDVLLARRGEMGRYALVTEREAGWLCGTGSFFLKLFKDYDRRFFGLTLEDPRLRRHLLGESVGTTMTNLNQRILLDAVVAVAPLAEQARIVARVDELMRLCDALEAQDRLEAEQHARLRGTLLGTLTDSSTPEELTANWQRVADHFDLLLDRPEAVDALEQTILQLAVRGLLVAQDSSDEPTSVLLEKVQVEKQALIAAGRTRREAPSTQIDSDEPPYELPTGWRWVRLRDIWLSSFYGPRFSSEEYVQVGGVPTIRTTDMTDGEIILKDPPRVQVPADKLDDYRIEPGDLLVTRSGSIGVMALFHLNMVAVPSAYLIRIRFSKNVDANYCLRFFLGDLGQSQLGLGTTSVGVPNVSASKMAEFLFPLPPRSEQTRIVARIDELRRLCADLRQRLTNSQTTQSRLAEALVSEVA